MKDRCEQCKAWMPMTAMEDWGECRAHAPTVIPCPVENEDRYATEAWPRTHKHHWCCEHESEQLDGNEQRKALLARTWDDEERALADLVMRFSEAMLTKLLAKKRVDGFSGWRDTSDTGLAENLWEGMADHIGKWRQAPNRLDQLVDVANYCAFIWNLPQEKAR